MAIRPVDLQGAFVGAQSNSTVLRNAEEAPAIAQSAQAAHFAAQVQKREETIEATAQAGGNKVRPRGEEKPDQQSSQSEQQPQRTFADAADEEPLGLAGEGRHFIDVTA